MKRTVCLLLAILMLILPAGCRRHGDDGPAESPRLGETAYITSALDRPGETAAPEQPTCCCGCGKVCPIHGKPCDNNGNGNGNKDCNCQPVSNVYTGE